MSFQQKSATLVSRTVVVCAVVVVALATFFLVPVLSRGTPNPHATTTTSPPGYWLLQSDGGVESYGATTGFGSAQGLSPSSPIVGVATTPDGGGYWLVSATGGVFSFGDARYHGSAAGLPLAAPVVGMASTPDGGGYWLVSADGGVLSYGDAQFHGSAVGLPPAAPVVGMATTPDGGGYWLVGSDGGVFSFGDARYHGAAVGLPPAAPVVGMAATSDGEGYWLVSADGGVLSYGDAQFHGSAVGLPLAAPVAGLATTSDGDGYWLVAADGGVFSFGDARYLGSGTAGTSTPARSVAIAADHGSPATNAGNPVPICGNASVLTGPASAPPGAVIVPSGDNAAVFESPSTTEPDKTYWFAPGVHTLGPNEFGQIIPSTGDTFIGAPGATLDGQGLNQSAFDGKATGVTIEYLTIEDFNPPGGQGAVNHDSGTDWTIERNTIQDNGDTPNSGAGGALMMGSGDSYSYNCLSHNGEYGLNAAGTGTFFENNEVAWNGLADFPDVNGCGCSGGVKYWDSTNATVTDNYIHDNYNAGLWFDTDNVGALINGNYIARNWNSALIYEISYNALIEDNTFVDNAWGIGSYNTWSFPMAAVYLNGSGGSTGLDGGLYSTLEVKNNTFTDNWGGVVAYQNPNRVCGSANNSSSGYCTVGNPAFTTATCAANDTAGATPTQSPDYFDGCQWKTDNVEVTGNTFNFSPEDIITGTDTLPDIQNSHCYSGSNNLDYSDAPPVGNRYLCGFNGLFSIYGSTDPYAAWVTPDAIMGQGPDPDSNFFASNTYSGPWGFQAYVQGASPAATDLHPGGIATVLNLSGWQAVWGQDVGSTTSG